MHDLQNISRRLDEISRDVEVIASKQDTISKLLALLAVHIPDIVPNEKEDGAVAEVDLSSSCLCQITFSDLKVGG